MTHHITRSLALGACWILGAFLLVLPTAGQEVVKQGRFVEKGHPVDGGVQIARDGSRLVLVLGADFTAKAGPDLAIFLSDRPVAELSNRDAIRGALRVGELQRARGEQRYPLPATTEPGRWRSVILHSETFSKLWGGADLR